MTSDQKDPENSSLVAHSSLLLVGMVRRPHGLKGELSVEPLTSFPERFVPGLSLVWTRGSEERRLRVNGVRPQGRKLLVTFEGVLDVDAARGLVGGDLSVPRGEAFPPPEGVHYSHELAGLPCFDPRGTPLGQAVRLEQTPGGPLLEIDT
ncbi:MAG TPA: ribosome maturation factor RimM, partial [Thermoanaerobaculia bacterium]